MTGHFDSTFRNLGADFDPFVTAAKVDAERQREEDIRNGRVVVQEVVQPTTVDELYC